MTKQRRCCTAGLLICVVMLMAMMCSAEQSSVEADASQTGHWNAEGSVRFHDIPEEHALDSSLPRGRQRVGEVCRVVMLEPLDRRIISFHLHHNITIVFQILCEADNQTSSSPPPASSELTGSILLDGHTFANFSIPAPLPSAAPQNFSLPLEVHQWFETNIVLRCHQAQPASLQAKCVGLTRTASLHEKHYFTVAIWRSSDPELNTWNTTGAIAELPFYLEAMDLVQSGLTLLSPRHAQKVPEGEQIDVIASLSAPYPPSVISVNLFFGKNKAVSVWPDWKLPALGSSDLPLLHVTVAFRPKVGKYPLRLEVVCARQGAVASLTSFFEIVPAHLTHAPPPKPPNWYPKDEEDEEEEEEDEEEKAKEEEEEGGAERMIGQAYFCSRREALLYGDSFHAWHQHLGDEVLRLDYALLNARSTVVDVGAHTGRWAKQVGERYNCTLHLFEPIPEHVERSRALLSTLGSKASVHPYGIAGAERGGGEGEMEVKGANSRIVGLGGEKGKGKGKEEGPRVAVHLKTLSTALNELEIATVDLLKLNVEGAEYEILESLVAGQPEASRFRNLQIQFHEISGESAARAASLRAALNRTHCLSYAFPFIWENWRLRDS